MEYQSNMANGERGLIMSIMSLNVNYLELSWKRQYLVDQVDYFHVRNATGMNVPTRVESDGNESE